MKSICTWVKARPLTAFFVLAYLLSWSSWIVGTLAPASATLVGYPFFAPGPLLAALIVTAVARGRTGLRGLSRACLRWRVRWNWYVVALGIPLGIALGAAELNVAFGAPAMTQPFLVSQALFALALRLVHPLDGPMGEEPGWRAFAQPQLQSDRSRLIATLILAMLVSGWHLPLVLAPGTHQLPPIALLATFAVTFWYGWIYNRTGGSAFMTLLAHAAEGVFCGAVASGFAGPDLARFFLLYTALWCGVALGLVICDRNAWECGNPKWPRPSPPKMETVHRDRSAVQRKRAGPADVLT